MRIALHTLGTRGDVQPYLALALGLTARGHDVMLVAPAQFEAFVRTHGIAFAALPGEFLALMDTPEGKAAISGSGGFAGGFKLMKQFRPIVRRQLTAEWQAARAFDPDLLIYYPKAIGAPHIAEKLAGPAILASPLPGFTPTRAFASPLLPLRSVGPFNRLTHSVMAGSGDALFRRIVGEWRENELGLPHRPRNELRPVATLYAYSANVLAPPADWPANVAVTGYWFLDDMQGWTPDPAFWAFLEGGEAPVYIGFGSMPGLDPAALSGAVVEALDRCGVRGVLATGGGALGEIVQAGHVHIIEGAPHDKLFPLMSACLHHGGAGSTGASLRAGKATAICPFFGDQPFWGRQVADLGVGPSPLSLRKLTVDKLAQGIATVVGDREMRRRAAEPGGKIRGENGVGTAIGFLERQGLVR